MWNQKHPQANIVVSSAKNYLVQWKQAQISSSKTLFPSLLEGDGAVCWVKPQVDKIKVSVDASVFAERNSFGLGMLVRDHNGELIQAKTICKHGMVEPKTAEPMTIKH